MVKDLDAVKRPGLVSKHGCVLKFQTMKEHKCTNYKTTMDAINKFVM